MLHLEEYNKKRLTVYSSASKAFDNIIDLHAIKHKQENNKPLKKITANLVKSSIVESDSIGSWLPLTAEKYKISPKLEDYVCVPVVIMPSDLPNRNGIAFPYHELLSFNPNPYVKRVAYKTWEASPTFYEHCFPSDTNIQTKEGSKTIENISEGDLVLTHELQYNKVLKKFNNGLKKVTKIRTYGNLFDIEGTENHPVYVIDRRQFFGGENTFGWRSNSLRAKDFRNFEVTPHWRPISDVYHGDYLCSPIDFKSELSVDKDFAFLVGIFIAEGSFTKTVYKDGEKHLTGIKITTGTNEAVLNEKIKQCLISCGYNFTYDINYQQRGADQFTINSVELSNRLYKLVGEYSHNKYLSQEIKSWDRESVSWLLGGYMSGDGHVVTTKKKEGVFIIKSVSKQLLVDIQKAFAYIGIPTGSCLDNPLKQKARQKKVNEEFKEGELRIIPRHDCGNVRIPAQYAYLMQNYVVGKNMPTKSQAKKDTVKMIVTPKYLLTPIYYIEREYKECEVYNIEVENDNSYVANNYIVHNCNENYEEAKGVIFAATITPIKGAEGDVHKVICLCGFDRTKDEELYNKIKTGQLTTYSMGAFCDDYVCNICGTRYSQGGCEHVSVNNPQFKVYPTPEGNKLAYYQAEGICGFETSAVNDPAYLSAQNNYLL